MSTIDQVANLKQAAAERAVQWVESGMVIGLGAGSTAAYALRAIAMRLEQGQLRNIVGIPCSREVEASARHLGIPLSTLEEHAAIDLTIDGADEVDPELNLIKGGGGALLHEKIVAQASQREIIIVDATKASPRLGTRQLLPVEVVQFCWGSHSRYLETLGARVARRQTSDGMPFVTDEGNFILDCAFGPIAEPAALATALEGRAGIVAHGLFLGLATDLVMASQRGVEHIMPRQGSGSTVFNVRGN